MGFFLDLDEMVFEVTDKAKVCLRQEDRSIDFFPAWKDLEESL